MKRQLFFLCSILAAVLSLGSCNKGDETTFVYEKLFTVRVLDPYTCYFVDDEGDKYLCLTSMEIINTTINRPLLNKERVYARVLGSSQAVSDEYAAGFNLGWLMFPVTGNIKDYPADGDTSAAGDDSISVFLGEMGGGYVNLTVQYSSDGRTEHDFTLYRIDDTTHEDYKPGYGLYELRHDAKGDNGQGILTNVLCFKLDESEYDKGAVVLVPDASADGRKVVIEADPGMRGVVDIINE